MNCDRPLFEPLRVYDALNKIYVSWVWTQKIPITDMTQIIEESEWFEEASINAPNLNGNSENL